HVVAESIVLPSIGEGSVPHAPEYAPPGPVNPIGGHRGGIIEREDIEPAVAVEVGHRQRVGVWADTVNRVAKRAVAAAGPDDHAEVDPVEDAVAGAVGQERRRRLPYDPWRGLRGLGAVPREGAGRETVFQDFEVGPMRPCPQRAASRRVT